MKAVDMTFDQCAEWILNRRPDIRSTEKYLNYEDNLIDMSMSCDLMETISFMKAVMNHNKETRNGYEFLAAYDIYSELKEGI